MASTQILAPGDTATVSTPFTVAAGTPARVGMFQGPVAAPGAPVLAQVAGGALGAATGYVKTTFVTPAGETVPSAEASLAVAANSLLVVDSPAAPADTRVTGWNVYVSNATGTETKQNAAPIAIGTNWTELVGGLIAGAALPGADTTGGGLPAGATARLEVEDPNGNWVVIPETLTEAEPSLVLWAPGTYRARRPAQKAGANLGICTG